MVEPSAALAAASPAVTLDPTTLDPLLIERAAGWAAELSGARPVPSLRPAWARPGWTARITEWLDRQLAWAGRPRTGVLEQQRTWSLSTLFRTETEPGALWLKSCMPRFHAEPALGRWLWEMLPDAVPGVLAIDAADRIVLLDEMDGPTAKDAGGEEGAPEAPAVLARIARMTEARVGELRAVGLHDRPLAQIPAPPNPCSWALILSPPAGCHPSARHASWTGWSARRATSRRWGWVRRWSTATSTRATSRSTRVAWSCSTGAMPWWAIR